MNPQAVVILCTLATGTLIDGWNSLYHYSGLNRLVQVRQHGTAEFDGEGRVVEDQTQASMPSLPMPAHSRSLRSPPTDARIRFEHYYYDGVPRVQDVIHQPTGSGGQQSMMGGGGSEPQPSGSGAASTGGDAAQSSPLPPGEGQGEGGSLPLEESTGEGDYVDEIDPDAEPSPVVYEEGPVYWAWPQAQGSDGAATSTDGTGGPPLSEVGDSASALVGEPFGGLGGEGGGSANSSTITYEVWRDREYFWGAGDVDELVLQSDRNGNVWYALLDGNNNVVGHTNFSGGYVYRQYTYDPYGQVIATESWGSNQPVHKVGFQGMFADRLSTDPNLSPLAVNPDGTPVPSIYDFRNRIYGPRDARFYTADPNATAQPILEAMAYNGGSLGASVPMFNLQSLYGDGQNLYQFVRSNPITGSDPLGLSDDFDYFSEADDLENEITGQKLYTLGAINEGASWASLGLETALDIGSSLVGLDVFKSVEVLVNGRGGFWEAIDVALALAPVAKAGAKALKLGALFRGRFFKAARGCNCFVAGTMVNTPDGKVPIEWVRVGDSIVTRSEQQPFEAPRIGIVTRIFRSVSPAIVWMTLSNGADLGVTPDHEVWTLQAGWTSAVKLVPGDAFLDDSGAPVEVLASCFQAIPTPVYNLEVRGTFTYFADGVWVHNRSCQLLFHMHHAFPKFLGGLENGTIAMLDQTLHYKYHGGLLSALSKGGLHKKRNMTWKAFFDLPANEGAMNDWRSKIVKLNEITEDWTHADREWRQSMVGIVRCRKCARIKREELYPNPIDAYLLELPRLTTYSCVSGILVGIIHNKLFDSLKPFLGAFSWGRCYLKGQLLADYRTLYCAEAITIRGGADIEYSTCLVCGKIAGMPDGESYVLRSELLEGDVFQDVISYLYVSERVATLLPWREFRDLKPYEIPLRDELDPADPLPVRARSPAGKSISESPERDWSAATEPIPRPTTPDESALPRFRYHLAPVDSGTFVPSETTCAACGQKRDWVYTGPIYGNQEYNESICPWCIADGSAYRELGVTFMNEDGIGGRGLWKRPSKEVIEELTCRTPGFTGWQEPMWFTCCGDAAAFLGRAGYDELTGKWAAAVPIIREACPMNEDDWPYVLDQLYKDGSHRAYVFQCLHCRKLGGYWDCE